MKTSEQIKPAPMTEAEFESAQEEFCNLLNVIERLPDARKRLGQVKMILELLADGTDGLVDFIPSEAVGAAEKLAEAFATLEEYRDYLPKGLYNDIADRLTDWISDSQWTSDAKLMRQVLPILLHALIEQDEEEEIEKIEKALP